ncbi:hypothetical protein O6H91_04G116500 [Diphasiastrum complanatum]|uniref:Uncharacterized protein n=1 Tax=Diphasiastrum complanatum TaxID=34168 RepID=A0ACC2E0W9_DIPCM|nr:hypothetical protein O6H91_04G116500 [Diphasiastrum complanatum]
MGEVAMQQFGNILLGGRGGMNPGHLKIHSGGFVWKKAGGGKVVEVSKADISKLNWMRVPKGYQLGIWLKAGSNVKFHGFREQDMSSLSNYFSSKMGFLPEEKMLAVSGQNWGEIDLEGNTLSFSVDGKQAFEVSVADVSQTQTQGKNDVVMDFHVDDTTSANEKDTLMEITFHVPNTNATFVGDEERPSAQVFCDRILSMADVGPSGAEAVALFEEVGILTPRGRYNVELHLSFFRLQGQANDFKIQYTSVVRLFVLPKSNQPHTFVVVTLDPPIRKGQTFYSHIVLQFPTEEVTECTLSINDELLNTKYQGRLEPLYKGLSHEVFALILRGLSGSKITRPGKFRSSQDGHAVRASLKAEEGTLYPLEKSFFFLPKPPTLIAHEEIQYIEFERHGAAGTSSLSSHYFDLIIRLKNDQEHQFRNIQRNEYHNLFKFIEDKQIKIFNPEAQGMSGVAAVLEGYDDAGVDPHLNRIRSAREIGDGQQEDSDEEDEDFVAEKDDAGSPSDDSEEEESDASESGGEVEEKQSQKVKKKADTTPKVTSKKKKADEDVDSGKKKKRKKDPNAPKRALSGFMYFSLAERESLRKSNPGISFTDTGRTLGEKWKNMSGEEKEPYEAKARVDKERYKEQMADYRSGAVPAGAEDGSSEEE